MIDFVVKPPFLRIALWVAMETIAFTHSRNKFFLEVKLFLHSAGPKE